MQTTDELTNIRTLFGEGYPGTAAANETERLHQPGAEPSEANKLFGPAVKPSTTRPAIDTEAQALNDLSAMPIYFASSYALVKPYVTGFDANVLDAPSLKKVRIDGNWKPPASPAGSNAR
jgi:hypothetical protein